jgi:hypothetical protein
MIRSAISAACLLALAPLARAQIQAYSIEGDNGFRPGWSVCWVGDVDGDGNSDWATSDPKYSGNRGQVRVHSGATGAQLGQFVGLGAQDWLGTCIAELGDVDGDGAPEVLALAAAPARALALSTGTWTIVLEAPLASWDDQMSMSGLGDVNGDGVPDFAAGDYGFGGSGRVWVHSGADGALIHTLFPSSADLYFGASVAGPGDLDGDGRGEILVGAPFGEASVHFFRGAARLYRGSNGTLWRSHLGGMSDGNGKTVEELGANVAGVGDFDLDGVPDYAAQSNYPGDQAVAYSGATGDVIHVFGNTGLGSEGAVAFASAGDVNGDGKPELLIEGFNTQWISLITLRNGAPPWEVLDKLWKPYMPGPLVSGRDVDGDGHPDLLLGERHYLDDIGGSLLEPTQHAPGRTRLLGLRGMESYVARACTTTLNSSGEPGRIWTHGSLSASDDALAMISWNLPANQIGLVYFGTASVQVPYGNGIRCVGGQALRLSPGLIGANGVLVTDVPLGPGTLPPTLLQPGVPVWFQCWFRDTPGGGAGFDYSDSVQVTLAP